MANKRQSGERNKNINRRWFSLKKPLQRNLTTTIDEQIRRTEVKLENLKSQKRAGITSKPKYERIREIDGIPLKFNDGGNKTIALLEVRGKNRNRYDAHEEVVLHWLKERGFMPDLCSVSMKGVC